MSYEIEGFDPTAQQNNPDLPFNTWHSKINLINVHVVHPQELYRRFEAGQKITLVDYEPEHGSNIKHVTAAASGDENYDKQPATLYDASIELNKEDEWRDQFVGWLDSGNFDRLKPESFHWSNVRLLRRPTTNLVMRATILSRSIQMSNQHTASNINDLLKTTRLMAPARGDVKANEQLVHVFDCITAGMIVAHSLNRDSLVAPRATLIATPDGPLYKNPDTGQYVHHLGTEKITVTGHKKPEKKQHSFDQLFGIDHIKAQLNPLILFYTRPEVAAKWQVKRPGNVLLHGPAGTGKTAIVYALAAEMNADIHEVSPADIYGRWMGDSEKGIKKVFDNVRNAKKPTILLFDEIEGIINVVDNDTSGSRATNAVAGIFKTESARVTRENPNVILAATTNSRDRIDEALIRAGRFDVKIAMGLPNDEARGMMFGNLILNFHSLNVGEHEPTTGEGKATEFNPYDQELLDPEMHAKLANLTDHDFSAADIVEVLRRAALVKADEEVRTGVEPAPIDFIFLAQIITSMRQSGA